jgi:hypothetical protein
LPNSHNQKSEDMREQSGALTNLQLELLQIFKYEIEEAQLLEIRDLLASYFAEKATQEMDKLWNEQGWSEETMEQWSKEHMRTEYKYRS